MTIIPPINPLQLTIFISLSEVVLLSFKHLLIQH